MSDFTSQELLGLSELRGASASVLHRCQGGGVLQGSGFRLEAACRCYRFPCLVSKYPKTDASRSNVFQLICLFPSLWGCFFAPRRSSRLDALVGNPPSGSLSTLLARSPQRASTIARFTLMAQCASCSIFAPASSNLLVPFEEDFCSAASACKVLGHYCLLPERSRLHASPLTFSGTHNPRR